VPNKCIYGCSEPQRDGFALRYIAAHLMLRWDRWLA